MILQKLKNQNYCPLCGNSTIFKEMINDMEKRAFLVSFEITTRVVVDIPKEFNPNELNLIDEKDSQAFNTIIKQARNNILEVPENYIYGGNAEIEEDTICPSD